MAGLDDARLAQDVFVVFLGLSLAFVSIARPSSARSLARSALDAAPFVVVPLCLARAALASVQSLLLGNAYLLVLWTALVTIARKHDVSDVHTLCVHLIPPVMTLSVLLAGVFFALPSIPRALHDLGTLLLGRPSYAFAPYVVLCLRRRAADWRARPSQASRPVVIAFSPSSGWSSVPADSMPSRARTDTDTDTRVRARCERMAGRGPREVSAAGRATGVCAPDKVARWVKRSEEPPEAVEDGHGVGEKR
mgnify:CR=1 FL=1